MRRRYGRLLKKDNVVVFPGALDGLIEKGLDAIEDVEYEKAVESFDQAYHFDPDNVRMLAPYAVSLYETKNFEKAKEVATKLLHSGATEYLDAMELYLAISIQLQDYEEVEMTIEALLEEDIVPSDMLQKFNYLRDLNRRLSHRYTPSEIEPPIIYEIVSIEEFKTKPMENQHELLATYENSDLNESVIDFLIEVVGDKEIHPLVITYAIVLLCGAGLEETVTVRKFGQEKEIIPADLELPGKSSVTEGVIKQISGKFEKDPSRFQLAIDAIQRYDVMAYPLKWDGFSIGEIAEAYMDYIESMFSGKPMEATKLNSIIKSIDEQTDK